MNLLELLNPSIKKEFPRRPYLFYLGGFKVSKNDGSTYVATHYAIYEFM
jgi:hypothetical protein